MTFEEACKVVGKIEPTKEELKNGWTLETLTLYMAERELAKGESILHPPQQKPQRTTNAFKWL